LYPVFSSILLRQTLLLVVVSVVVPVTAPPARAFLLKVPSALPTIQAALDVATAGDTVLVAPGTYLENLVMGADQDGVTLLSEKGPDSTTIDGGLTRTVIRCDNVGSDTRIEGFTIANGRATAFIFGRVFGAGVLLDTASVTISGNVFRDNEAWAQGGGLYVRAGSPTVTGNTFQDNNCSSGLGGGLYCADGGTPVIEDNEFIGNTASTGGAGIACLRCPAQIRNNTFTGNQLGLGTGGGVYVSASTGGEIRDNRFESNSASAGGAILITRSNPLIQDNEIISNSVALGAGGGIYILESSTPEVRGNLLVSNTSGTSGGGIAVADTSNPQLIGNTLVSNSAALSGGGLYVTLFSNPSLTGNILVGSSTGHGIYVETGDQLVCLQRRVEQLTRRLLRLFRSDRQRRESLAGSRIL
jgi:parallel beta-helix repeat protein